MRKQFFIVSIGFVALVAGSIRYCLSSSGEVRELVRPSRIAMELKTASVSAKKEPPATVPRYHPEHKSVSQPRAPLPPALQIPLEFEKNSGQAPDRFGYVAHGSTYALGLAATEIALSLHSPKQANTSVRPLPDADGAETPTSQVHLRLLGSNQGATVQGLEPKRGVSNYFLGSDPAQWHTNVPHFGRVKVAGAYPGIDLVYYGNPQQLEYDFQVAPGADPTAIRVEMAGATSTRLDVRGNLILDTPVGKVELKHPDAYQEIAGVRRPVKSEFRLTAGNTVQFGVGEYDHAEPLIIDPVLLYGVAIGGSNGNQGVAVDVDSAGNAYVTGNTCSTDFPSTAGNFQTIQTNAALQKCYDTFVVKLDPTASTLLYSDYIGGSSTQSGTAIAVDSTGAAFVTGLTTSVNFPLVNNIGPTAPVPCNFSSTGYSCPDAFLFKLSPDGSHLLFSSLMGGSQTASGFAVKLDSVTGDLLVLGATNSSNFTPAPNTLESAFPATSCASGIPCVVSFLLAFDPGTGAYRYGTYFSGAGSTFLTGLSVDGTGDIYVTGNATPPMSASLGAVTNTYAPSGASAGGADIVVARLHPSSGALSTSYLTLIQGEADEAGASVAVDAAQNAYITGATASLHLPVTASAFQPTATTKSSYDCMWIGQFDRIAPKDCGTGFVGKLSSAGALSFLTYLGGSTGQDIGQTIGVDASGNIWTTGVTGSSDFPLSSDAYKQSNSYLGPYSPYLAKMSNDGTALPFATLMGGSFGQATGMKIDASGNVYTTGYTSAQLTTPRVYPNDPSTYNPVFVQKWGPGPQPILQLSTTSLTFGATPFGGVAPAQTVTAQNTGSAAMEIQIQLATNLYTPALPPGFQESDNCGTSLAAGASCTITVAFEPVLQGPSCVIANNCNQTSPSGVIVVQNNAAAGYQSVSLSGTTGHGAAVAVAPNPIVFGPQAAGTQSADLYVEVQSQGDLPLSVSNAAIGGPNAADFKITSIGTCNRTVALGLIGCNLQLAFSPAPTSTGTRTASLILTDNAGDSPQSIPMSGIVTGPGASLVVTQGPLNLGTAAIGAASLNEASVYLTNSSSNTPVQVTALTIAGNNAVDFTVTTGSCGSSGPPFTIAAGATCFVPVFFRPLSGSHGPRNATLSIATNPAIAGLPVIALTGDAITNSDSGISVISVPSPQSFGSIQIGNSSQAGQNLLTISPAYPIPCAGGATSCGGPLTISSLTFGLSDYTVLPLNSGSYCTNPPLTIPSGSYGCTFQIVFTPTATGSRNTTLSINSNDPLGPTIIPLFGSGLALPLGNLSTTQLGFGNSAIGVASPPLTVTLQNIGQTNLSFSGATASTNFSVASNNCPATLPPSASCTIAVSFTPPSAGQFNGTLTLTDNDYYGAQQTVTLSGTGATGPQLRLTPSTFNFGNQAINTTSAAQTLTVVNTGDTVVTFPVNAFRASQDYIVQDTSCGSTLGLGASCVVNLQFKPRVSYYDPGTLLITDNAPGNPQPIALGGTGTTSSGAPTITLTSSANPTASGVPVTFTATVAAPSVGLPVPTGTVSFYDYINLVGTATLNASGQASVTTTSLSVGTHTLNAIYNGNGSYSSVSSLVLSEVVNPASNVATTSTAISSINPSAFGQTVVFTVTVAGSGSTPTGSVIFLDGTTTIGTVPLNGAAQALLATASLATGSHSITAMYSGNANYAGSTSPVLTQVVNASTGVGTTTTLVSSANPASGGQAVSYTATVVGAGGNSPVPTGTITFVSGTTNLGTALLNVAGQASISAGALSAGTYSITAIYSGDATYAGSSSAALAEVSIAPPYLWLANGNQSLSKIGTAGAAFSPPAGYPGGGLAIAIDGSGNVWSGASGSVSMLNSTGGATQTFTGGGVAIPASIAIAGDGSVWIANTNGTVANLSNAGSALSPSAGYNGGGLSTPAALAIDGSGNVWIANSGDSSLTEFVGAAAPVVTPLATATKNVNQGGKP